MPGRLKNWLSEPRRDGQQFSKGHHVGVEDEHPSPDIRGATPSDDPPLADTPGSYWVEFDTPVHQPNSAASVSVKFRADFLRLATYSREK
jgi:hypothetical protein